jgi:hypothetical protein
VAITSPSTFERSEILGHPPIDTSPRPSATGSLQSATDSTVVGGVVGVVVAVGVGVEAGAGVGFATATPLFQSNFLPDLMQVNVFPAATDLFPALLQAAPALTDACEEESGMDKMRAHNATNAVFCLNTLKR